MSKKKEALPIVSQTQEMVSADHADIRNMIHLIRGQQVMLDSDLAFLYQVETKRLNERVKRNPQRFPESFCFQLTMELHHPTKWSFSFVKVPISESKQFVK